MAETTRETLAFMTECTLATVESLAMKRRPPAGELKRQIYIAQVGIRSIRGKSIDPEYSRTCAVIREDFGDVEAWSKRLYQR